MASYILASQSPRRKQLLEWAEIDFEIRVANTDESYPEGLTPSEVAVHIAREKARVIAGQYPGKPVIAADTIVVLGSEIIGKPANRAEAIATLTKLSGAAHEVITGVAIQNGEQEVLFHDVTAVQFHPLTAEQIAFYVDKYGPYDKAGAYAIQEWIGVVGIKSIQGDFYNVMGLPVSRVVQALRDL
ncbi:Maf family protein [Flaviaesturariibacter amylovorans]|uniref:dTTP/UTP pyrophosphatase n=1 Tax=Flaviaesturariibacter amylovorans TaxID=1084520 RepID=A0ABP8GU39_9BACT